MENSTTSQNAELWSPVPVYTSIKHSRTYGSGKTAEEKAERLLRARGSGSLL